MSTQLQYKSWLKSKSLWKQPSVWEMPLFCLPQEDKALTAEIPTAPEKLVFGKRIEKFFSHLIQAHPNYNLISENVQLIENKNTLGELDFLVEDKSNGRVLHIEHVFKFYLFDKEVKGDSYEKWIGANRNDSLQQKLNKLKEHQFPVLKSLPAQRLLKKLELEDEDIDQQLCFNGFLFTRKEEDMLQSDLNSNCWAGFWVHRDEFNSSFYQGASYHLPQKNNWIMEARFDVGWQDYVSCCEQIDALHFRKKSPLLWMKRNDQLLKLFVVWW
jgi:hypothetical protein